MVSSTTSLTNPNGTTAGTGTSASQGSGTPSIFKDYSAFLTLLTTQLKHQDPLNPTDTAQYTQQLVEYASVEQQMKSNSTLTSIDTAVSSNAAAGAIGYVGKTVMAEMNSTKLANGAANWEYTLPSIASNVQLTVTDSAGNTVYQTSGNTASGTHAFTWDGVEGNGSTAPDGSYTLAVAATDGSGQTIASTTYAQGTATGVDSSSGTARLIVDGNPIALNNILSVGVTGAGAS